MPRIIVTTDHAVSDDAVVILDEQVASAQLSEDRGALQFIERLGWAISDAEDARSGASLAQGRPPARARKARGSERTPGRRRTRRWRGSPVASLLPREVS